MTLEELKQSISTMSSDELKALILKERADRRNSGRKIKARPKKVSSAEIEKFTVDEIQELLDLLGD